MRKLFFLSLLFSTALPILAQKNLSGSADTRLSIEKLNVVGNVLMIAAHPDDENTALLAWLAKGRKYRTGYLSLTRGEGGQNLIGSEQGDLMGVIRTQELMSARRIDGAEQFFTRAIDFGFSKVATETFTKWDREQVLADVVWVVRNFKPDVIILRFSGTPRDGHGQHQASAILGKEAFRAAADPKRFPEQLKYVQPWQAKRIMTNLPTFTPAMEKAAAEMPNTIQADSGEFDPLLGYSFGEIAGMSRSQHRSQAMGWAETKGAQKNYLVMVDGEAPAKDLFDGVDTSWKRVAGAARVDALLSKALIEFSDREPQRSIPALLEARKLLIGSEQNYLVKQKLAELDEAIAKAAGLWLDATADRAYVVPGSTVKVKAVAINRSGISIELKVPVSKKLEKNIVNNSESPISVDLKQEYSEPYWLKNPKHGDLYDVSDYKVLGDAENKAAMEMKFIVYIEGTEITYMRPVIFRYVDRVRGELIKPVVYVPPVTMRLSERSLIFPSRDAKNIEVQVTTHMAGSKGEVKLQLPAGWRVEPATNAFELNEVGSQVALKFRLTPPAGDSLGPVKAIANINGREVAQALDAIAYEHIPPQAVFPPAEAKLVRADIKMGAKRIGYIMGAGDDVPQYLRQLGCEVVLLSAEDLARTDLKQFDAVLTGVRAYNTRADLRANVQRIFDYVKAGGTYVVQYNVMEGGFFGGDPKILENVGPYPMKITNERVTEEDAQVEFAASHPLMSFPNTISQNDFKGWVQERGLYFANPFDAKYVSLLSSHDTGEANLTGGTLYTRYGQGHYIFTPLSWFRQLPAGVPGAYRIFANLLSAGKNPQ